LLARHPPRQDSLIPILRELQQLYGYLPLPALRAVAEYLGLPPAKVLGVATFYADFHLTPQGRHQIRVCRGTACHVRGGKRILNAIKAELGIEEGESTPDFMFSLRTVACLGVCPLSPVVIIDSNYYGKMTPRKAIGLLRQISQVH
jgi:NADH-quinone oxidoreductase subunit E